ncbi:uncharacterized protein LOC144497475 [Mustelus asterias]
MEEGESTDAEVRSGTSDAGNGDTDTVSPTGGADPPEEDQSEGAHEADCGGNPRDTEEEEAEEGLHFPSPYLEMLTEPANRAENIQASTQVGDGLADGVIENGTLPPPQSSELGTSVDSGLNRESDDDGNQEDSEMTDCSACTDTHDRLSHPTDRREEDRGTSPQDDCNPGAVKHLMLDLLPLDTSNGNNTTKCLTPDFSEVFFDLVWEVQSRRLNDQRCSFRKKLKDRRAYRSMPSTPLDREKHFFPSTSSLQTEEFFDLIACSQSKRLNDQRADFEDSPTVEIASSFSADIIEYLAPVGRTAFRTQRGESPVARPTERDQPPAEGEDIPAEGAGSPEGGDGSPAGGDGSPAGGVGSPAGGDGIPAGGDGIPAGGDGIPAGGDGSPAGGDGIPAGGDGIPAGGDGIPAGGDGTPTGGDGIPAGGDGIPAGGDGSPAGGDVSPAGGDGSPTGGDGSLVRGEGSPAGEAGNPAGGEGSPAGGDGSPAGGDGTPAGGEGIPAGGDESPGNPAGGDGNAAGGDGNVAGGDGNPAGGDGTPAEGDGSPAGGDGSPAGADGSPTGGDGSPVRGEGSPAGEAGSPAGGEGSPAGGDRSPGNPTEGVGDPAEGDGSPAGGVGDPAVGDGSSAGGDGSSAGEAGSPADGAGIPAGEVGIPAGVGEILAAKKKEPDDELYNTIMTHQSASARIEDQRSKPPAYSSQAFFDLLHRLQEQRMDEQRAPLPPSLAPKRAPTRVQEERRGSIFSPLLKGMSQRRAHSN